MFASKFALIGVVLMLVLVLVMGGLGHALLPHTHSHDGGGVDIGWSALHSMLRGSENKILLIVGESAALFLLCFLAVSVLLQRLPALQNRKRRHDREVDILRRGIVAYRRFG